MKLLAVVSIADLAILLSADPKRMDTSFLSRTKIQEDWDFVRNGEFHRRSASNSGGGQPLGCSSALLQGSGIGDSAQEATAGGLRQALRLVGNSFHAVRVEEILMKQYPWFFLARVTVRPYQIDFDATLLPSNETSPSIFLPPMAAPFASTAEAPQALLKLFVAK